MSLRLRSFTGGEQGALRGLAGVAVGLEDVGAGVGIGVGVATEPT